MGVNDGMPNPNFLLSLRRRGWATCVLEREDDVFHLPLNSINDVSLTLFVFRKWRKQ
jgi:hypothetical protein